MNIRDTIIVTDKLHQGCIERHADCKLKGKGNFDKLNCYEKVYKF